MNGKNSSMSRKTATIPRLEHSSTIVEFCLEEKISCGDGIIIVGVCLVVLLTLQEYVQVFVGDPPEPQMLILEN
jgi:hypothetical protein